MKNRRMFSNAIVNSDIFLDLPLSTQALYFHLVMEADDEGFVGNPKRTQRFIGASDDDMQNLINKRYILTFPSGIIVIKHWYIHNYIPKDRYNTTTYTEEKQTLTFDDKKGYTEKSKRNTKRIQTDIQDADKMDTQIKLNEIKLNENKLKRERTRTHEKESDISMENDNNFKSDEFSSDLDCLNGIPTFQEVKDFITLKEYKIDPEYFYNYYAAQGWKRNGQPIENWQALATQWGRTEALRGGLKDLAGGPTKIKGKIIEPDFDTRKYSQDELDKIFKNSEINDSDI